MPWVKPCTEEEMKCPEVLKAVRDAIQTLVYAGYEHDDLQLRHVGLYKKDSKHKALLFACVLTVDVTQGKKRTLMQFLE